MNSCERIGKVLSNEPADRRPVSALLSLYGAKLTDCDLEKYYSDPRAFFEGQVAVVEKFDPDIIFTPAAVAKEAEAWGCGIKYFNDAPPNRIVTVRSIEEIEQLVFPEIQDSIYEHYFLVCTRMMAKKYKGIKPIGAMWLDAMDLLISVIGPELYMSLLLFNREKYDRFIEKLTVFTVDYANALLDAGADFLIDFLSAGNMLMITKEMARDIAYPILEKSYQQIKGNILIHHGGYKIESYIDIYKNLPNLMGFAIDKSDNLLACYEKILKTQILVGNISGPSLDRYSPEQIKAICQKKLNDMNHAHRYILMTTSADIPYETTEEQIHALFHKDSDITSEKAIEKGEAVGIACGIFEQEIKHLIAQKRIDVPFVFLDSTLHMNPELLQAKLDKVVIENLEKYKKVLLIYGDCHPYMMENYDSTKVVRLEGMNCCSIVLGSMVYRKLRSEGAFFVFYEWAHRWREIFVDDIGLTERIAPLFMKSLHKSIVYLDTGTDPIPVKILEDMSRFFDLPYEVLQVNLDILCDAIINSLKR